MSAHKGTPLTRKEVKKLIELVEANPAVYNKATNATNNRLKDATWAKITDSFNAIVASSPRRPEQLRLKWENLKKNARKRNTKIRINQLKTDDGKPDYIPPDDILDKVASIIGSTCTGDSVAFGGDATVEDEVVDETVEEAVVEVEEDVVEVEEDVVEIHLPTETIQPLLPASSHTTLKFFLSSAASKGKLKRQSLADEAKISIIKRNNAIAEYYISKRKREQELHELKRKKYTNIL